MYYILRFNLRKGEGQFPSKQDVLSAFPDADYEQLIRSSLQFSFNNDNSLINIVDWKLVDDGLHSFELSDEGVVTGYPQPVVWLELEEEVDVDDEDAWTDALSSDYILTVQGVNDDEPFYFQDHNGYSKVESAEWLADDLWDALKDYIQVMEDGDSKDIAPNMRITRIKETNDEGLVLSLEIQSFDKSCKYSWLFETEQSIDDFDFYDSKYTDSEDQPCAENNPMIYKLHTVFCQKNV